MAIRLDEKFVRPFITDKELSDIAPEVEAAAKALKEGTGKGAEMLGWMRLPENYDRGEFARIKAASERIKKNCDLFIVIGIGGSYLGARAAVEFLSSTRYNLIRKDTPEIYFSGRDICGSALEELIGLCEGRDVCINVISKSGTTTEPAIAFRCFRALLEKKYGAEGARERIFVTTDKARGTLKKFADEAGYETFVVPDDVGGRYSVLTAVGLLPIAVSGVDLDELMGGARDAMIALDGGTIDTNDAYRYAALRNILYRQGKVMEIFVGYEHYEQLFCEWWKQLFGESEGKDGKGLYPASVVFSTDLHSLGQYIQSGMRTMFETVLDLADTGCDIEVPYDEANIDGLNFLAGKKMSEVNRTAMNGTLLAHVDGGVPNIVLRLDERTARSLGYMIYFFELACAVSGYVLGVNPFDQPGVEAYKKNMFALLGKPGYEEMTEQLRARI